MEQRSLPVEPLRPGAGGAGEANEASWGSAVKLGAETVGRLLGLATTLLIARGLGVADFGLFAALSGIAVIAAEASELGLQATASRELVAGTFGLAVMVRAKLTLTLPVLASAGALLPFLPLVAPLLLYYTLAGWSEFLGVALRARRRRGGEAATILCLRVAGLAFVAVALRWRGGLTPVAWALALSTLPAILLAWALLLRAPGEPSSRLGAEASVRRVLRSALPLGINGGLALVSLKVELLALALLRAAREAGLYAAALRVVEFLTVVPSSISAGAMPALTREGMRREGPVRGRTATTVALLAAPAAVGLALVAPGLLALLFGPEYASAAGPLRILAVGLVPLFMNSVLLHSLIAVGRADRLPRLTGLRVAAAAVLAAVLIPALGAAGAALGLVASETALLVLASRACAAAGFDVPVVRPVGLALCVSLPMGAAVAFAGRGPLGSLALGLVTYALTLLAAWRLAPRLRSLLALDVRHS